MKNIHLISTDKPSKLQKTKHDNFFLSFRVDLFTDCTSQHIYITSDEVIREGDWFIRDGSIHKCFRVHRTDIEFLTSIDSVYCGSNTFWNKERCKKIILTTDQDLIKDSVQAIDDTFLKWFVNNPSCEYVEVERLDTFKKTNEVYVDEITGGNYYEIIKHNKIIIPQKETKKETLEEAAEKYSGLQAGTFTPPHKTTYKHGFEDGAKWHAERSYSEEEVRQAFRDGQSNMHYSDNYGLDSSLTEQQWFEQFKKK
jgi:hypothetical protein